MERRIICVDMDAFFASVEQKTNPALKGKPTAVVGSNEGTVITTSSCEARAFGVRTGMTVPEARRLCPELILIARNNARYTHTCSEISEILSHYTPELETYSVDEAFLDVTETEHLFGGAREIGKAVRNHFGIGCTVGIGPNILIAKLASDVAKSDGLLWVRQEEVGKMLERLPVNNLWGIGKKRVEELSGSGIRTCGELGRTPVSLLRNRFGILGEALKRMGLGLSERPLQTRPAEQRSVGHSMTLRRNIRRRE